MKKATWAPQEHVTFEELKVGNCVRISHKQYHTPDADPTADTAVNRIIYRQEFELTLIAIQLLPKKRRAVMEKVLLYGQTIDHRNNPTESTHYKLGIKQIREYMKRWKAL